MGNTNCATQTWPCWLFSAFYIHDCLPHRPTTICVCLSGLQSTFPCPRLRHDSRGQTPACCPLVATIGTSGRKEALGGPLKAKGTLGLSSMLTRVPLITPSLRRGCHPRCSTQYWEPGIQAALSSISWCLDPGWNIEQSAGHSPHAVAQVLVVVVQQLKGVDLRRHSGRVRGPGTLGPTRSCPFQRLPTRTILIASLGFQRGPAEPVTVPDGFCLF